jgi:hypothetical protein
MASSGGSQRDYLFHKIFIPVPAFLFLAFASLGQIRGADSGQVSGRIFDGSGAVVARGGRRGDGSRHSGAARGDF